MAAGDPLDAAELVAAKPVWEFWICRQHVRIRALINFSVFDLDFSRKSRTETLPLV